MDTKTLAVCLVLVLAALSTLAALVAVGRKSRPLNIWAVGLAGSSAGFLFILGQGPVTQALSVLLGNLLILTYNVAIPYGLRTFLGVRRPWPPRYTILLVVLWLLIVWFYLVVPSYPVRVSLVSGAIILFMLEFLWVLNHYGKSISRRLSIMLTFNAVSFVVFHAYRTIAVHFIDTQSLLTDQVLTPITFVVTMLFSILWAGSLLILDSSRLQQQVRQDAEEMARLNQLKDRVLAMTSHDLRGPLGNLRLLWSSLGQRLQDGQCTEVDRDMITMIDRSLAGNQSLLENLFSFAESQRAPLDPEALADLELASTIVRDQWESPARTKGVSLTVESSGPLWVRAEFSSVVTILRNLVGNAVKYTPTGGKVVLKLAPSPEGRSRVEVVDTGVGMAAEVMERSFSGASRSSRPGTEGERGSGFGLVLVKELLATWKGTLGVESQPGVGTRVWIEFAAHTSS